MLNNTEAIYAALFAKFQNMTEQPFKTISRRLLNQSEVTGEQMPALFMLQGDQVADTPRRGIPTKWNLKLELWMYFWQEDNRKAIMPTINPILDQVRAAIAPDDMSLGELTLGGYVSHCRTQGQTRIYEGVNDGNLTVVVMPLDLMLAA